MQTGQVKWFSDEKGYGFIQTPACEADVFVHFSAIDMQGYKSLKPQMSVVFELSLSDRGPSANRVRPALDEAPVEATPEQRHRHRRLKSAARRMDGSQSSP